MALRAGAWIDPDHRIRNQGPDPVVRSIWRKGDDELHYAVGMGFVLAQVQIDVAADFSEPVDIVSVSAIYKFR